MSNGIFREASPTRAKAITKSDSVANEFSGIYVGGTGDVKVTTVEGDAVVFSAVPAGTTLRIQTVLVWSTGTTATNMVGLG